MTANEMAAIAAGLWEPGQKCNDPKYKWRCSAWLHGDYSQHPHNIPAPDMHLPENLWRGFEVLRRKNIALPDSPEARDAVFAALVAVYKAEHPE